jgi:hypothetical protein
MYTNHLPVPIIRHTPGNNTDSREVDETNKRRRKKRRKKPRHSRNNGLVKSLLLPATSGQKLVNTR